MKINLRQVGVRWINLDAHLDNALALMEEFSSVGITRHMRIPGVVKPAPENSPAHYGKHFIGCGEAHINAFNSVKSLPVLILEEDAKIAPHFRLEFDIPDDADAIYLGTSVANRQTAIIDVGNPYWFRVVGMLAAHAILYVSERYFKEAYATLVDCIRNKQVPLDIGLADIQRRYNIYAPKFPFYTQSADRKAENSWEGFTNKELTPTHKLVSE